MGAMGPFQEADAEVLEMRKAPGRSKRVASASLRYPPIRTDLYSDLHTEESTKEWYIVWSF